jgi:hypothetical protein
MKPRYNYRVYRFNPDTFRFEYILAFRSEEVVIESNGFRTRRGFYTYESLGLLHQDVDCVDSFITAFAPLEDS